MTRYLVIGIKNPNRYGVDYASAFMDDYGDAFANAEMAYWLLGTDSVISLIKNPFTNDALTTVFTKADFEHALQQNSA